MRLHLVKQALAVALTLSIAAPAAAAGPTYYPAPAGYTAMLEREPYMAYPGRESWEVTTERLELLRAINWLVNASFTYAPDPEGTDVWGVGSDCEDYAIRKMLLLLGAGVPRGAMNLAMSVVNGQGHAVLVVDGWWVLDNLMTDVAHVSHYPGQMAAQEATGGEWRSRTNVIGLEALLP
jgi:predicted transglutaminase-like cysteine proteinase